MGLRYFYISTFVTLFAVTMLNFTRLVRCKLKYSPRVVCDQSNNRAYTDHNNKAANDPPDNAKQTSSLRHQTNSSRPPSFARARRKLSPALRLASMLPDDFWKDQGTVDCVLPAQEITEKKVDEKSTPSVVYNIDVIQSEAYKYGDSLMITLIRKFRKPLKKLFYNLSEKQTRRISTYGNLADDDIVGKKALDKVSTDTGHVVLLSRPTVEDYLDIAPKCTSTLSSIVSTSIFYYY